MRSQWQASCTDKHAHAEYRESMPPGHCVPSCPPQADAFVPPHRPAFTLIELLVVMSIIVIVLLIALPGLSAMNADMRQNAAVQQIQTVLSRAYHLAIEKSTVTAVRFVPANWDDAKAAPDRQRLVVYQYTAESERWDGSAFKTELNEYFKRAQGIDAVELPEDAWVAPLESLAKAQSFRLRWDKPTQSPVTQTLIINNAIGLGRAFVLDGKLGNFAYDPIDGDGVNLFFNADDFIIVFDARNGLLAGSLRAWRMRAYSPITRDETDRDDPSGSPTQFFQRVAFGGLIVYPREAFLAATVAGDSVETTRLRQDLLAEKGQPYIVNRFGGQLTPAGSAAP